MKTLFGSGNNIPTNHQPKTGDEASPTPSVTKPSTKAHTGYMLKAIASVKLQIDKTPFEFKTSAEFLTHLNTPNRTSVEKAFKAVYGVRIKEYLVKERLRRAKKMLTLDLPKKTIAYKCRYGSLSAFCTAFKKEFGITPTEWERIYQESIAADNNAKK